MTEENGKIPALWTYDGPARQRSFQFKITDRMHAALMSLPETHGGFTSDHLRRAMGDYLDKLGVKWRAEVGD